MDSDAFPNSIQEVVTQPHQFAGYRVGNPIDSGILALVQDVLARWSIEQSCLAGVGRVLPSSYLFFSGNGQENIFREQYASRSHRDWSLPSPYLELKAQATEQNRITTTAQQQKAWMRSLQQIS